MSFCSLCGTRLAAGLAHPCHPAPALYIARQLEVDGVQLLLLSDGSVRWQ